jgi:hypothetical protein
MNTVYLKMGLSVVEIVIGAICISVSTYYLIDFQNCNPNAEFCKPLTMLPVVIFLVPGVIALAAGMVSCLMKRIAFWKVQVTMIAFIVLYYILFFAFILVVGN